MLHSFKISKFMYEKAKINWKNYAFSFYKKEEFSGDE